MVKHIVLYTFKEDVNKDEAVGIIASVRACAAHAAWHKPDNQDLYSGSVHTHYSLLRGISLGQADE